MLTGLSKLQYYPGDDFMEQFVDACHRTGLEGYTELDLRKLMIGGWVDGWVRKGAARLVSPSCLGQLAPSAEPLAFLCVSQPLAGSTSTQGPSWRWGWQTPG